ncbi:MAG: hypothetical protein JW818_21865 [Pirellulales bacterium]|nr:hypothetical protein [Pirellulales bacterium]
MGQKRKRIKHYHEPGDFHELTFSCYQNLSLLDNDERRGWLAESLNNACKTQRWRLVAYVFMLEHVHLLVLPQAKEPKVGAFLAALKRPFSARVKQALLERNDPLLKRLTIQERPGKIVFRFWQEGAGYDRNLQTKDAVLASIDYLHNNPIRRGLCAAAVDWRWSSAERYANGSTIIDQSLPRVDGLPAEFW